MLPWLLIASSSSIIHVPWEANTSIHIYQSTLIITKTYCYILYNWPTLDPWYIITSRLEMSDFVIENILATTIYEASTATCTTSCWAHTMNLQWQSNTMHVLEEHKEVTLYRNGFTMSVSNYSPDPIYIWTRRLVFSVFCFIDTFLWQANQRVRVVQEGIFGIHTRFFFGRIQKHSMSCRRDTSSRSVFVELSKLSLLLYVA